MHRFKQILTITMAVMMALVFVPMMPGMDGESRAVGDLTNVAQIGGTQYPTVQTAITAATNGQTVQMIADSNENVTVANGKDILLDLNGHVLKGTGNGNGSVIEVGSATLNIVDSSKDTLHYFKVSESGLWVLQSETPQSSTYTFDSVNGLMKDDVASVDIPAANSIIEVKGGCITGGTGKIVSDKRNVSRGELISTRTAG